MFFVNLAFFSPGGHIPDHYSVHPVADSVGIHPGGGGGGGKLVAGSLPHEESSSNNLQHISEREPDDWQEDPSLHPTTETLFMEKSKQSIQSE